MKIRNLNHLTTFAALAEMGSFAKAARRLRMPTSTVSEHIASLEKALGVQLVIRTTRQNRLTEAGQILADGAARMVAGVAETWAQIDAMQDHLQGTLRLSLPFAFSTQILGPAVARFAALYPKIKLDIQVSNQIDDLISGGFDLAVRIGPLADSSMIGRNLGSLPLHLVASASYLARRGRPADLASLAVHSLVAIRPKFTISANGPRGPETHVFDARVSANDPLTLAAILRGGEGIGVVPEFLVQDGLRDGSLEVLLPEYRLAAAEIAIVYYAQGVANPRADLFANFLHREMRALMAGGKPAQGIGPISPLGAG